MTSTPSYRITLLPGDGIGPEITAVARQLLDAVSRRHGFGLEYNEQPMGGAAIDATGEPLPASTLEACRAADAVLLAAIGSPRYDSLPREKRPETGLLGLRAGMGLFANLRPVKIIPALIDASTLKREVIEGVDLLVVRELTGGVYFGTPKGRVEADGHVRGFKHHGLLRLRDRPDREGGLRAGPPAGRKALQRGQGERAGCEPALARPGGGPARRQLPEVG